MLSANEMGRKSWEKRVLKYGEKEATRMLKEYLVKARQTRIDNLKKKKEKLKEKA